MDWNNVDLDSPCERDKYLIHPLKFEDFLLVIEHNVRDINGDSIEQKFEEIIELKVKQARETFKANSQNILNKAIEYRDTP